MIGYDDTYQPILILRKIRIFKPEDPLIKEKVNSASAVIARCVVNVFHRVAGKNCQYTRFSILTFPTHKLHNFFIIILPLMPCFLPLLDTVS